jgi:hypothetical protein
MQKASSRRAKVVLFASRPVVSAVTGKTEYDYAVYASY